MSVHIEAARHLVAATRRLSAVPRDPDARLTYDTAVSELDRLGAPKDLLDMLWWTVAVAEAGYRIANTEPDGGLGRGGFQGLCNLLPYPDTNPERPHL